MKLCALPRRDFHHRDQHSRAQAPIHLDPLAIEPIDEGEKIVRRCESRRRRRCIAVAHQRQFAKLRVEQMCGDIFHLPRRRDRLHLPFVWPQRPKQLDQTSLDHRQEMGCEDGLHVRYLNTEARRHGARNEIRNTKYEIQYTEIRRLGGVRGGRVEFLLLS